MLTVEKPYDQAFEALGQPKLCLRRLRAIARLTGINLAELRIMRRILRGRRAA